MIVQTRSEKRSIASDQAEVDVGGWLSSFWVLEEFLNVEGDTTNGLFSRDCLLNFVAEVVIAIVEVFLQLQAEAILKHRCAICASRVEIWGFVVVKHVVIADVAHVEVDSASNVDRADSSSVVVNVAVIKAVHFSRD